MKVPKVVQLVMLIVVVVGGALGIGIWSSATFAAGCTTHKVTIQSDKVVPGTTTGKVCDKLEIVNTDNVTRIVAFGEHEHHIAYDGVEDRVLHRNESLTVTFDKAGSFHFHDHLHDEVQGYFTVTK